MAKSTVSDNLITLKCTVCKRKNYYVRKNKKKVERKLEFKRYCKWCRKHTAHKEARMRGK
ncbi:MAG: 50S ribosomal protein L33 [bacterium]|nr:50S ribosomal protein L33 [bacterium]